ncbi:hypothetical protein BHM03_00051648, partial [Ensete ventricosum]
MRKSYALWKQKATHGKREERDARSNWHRCYEEPTGGRRSERSIGQREIERERRSGYSEGRKMVDETRNQMMQNLFGDQSEDEEEEEEEVDSEHHAAAAAAAAANHSDYQS